MQNCPPPRQKRLSRGFEEVVVEEKGFSEQHILFSTGLFPKLSLNATFKHKPLSEAEVPDEMYGYL